MSSVSFSRQCLLWSSSALVVLLLLLVALVIALDAGYLRRALIEALTSQSGHHIQVNGKLQVHLMSLHPHLMAEQVTISNPSWMPPGIAASIDRVTVDLVIPGQGHWMRIDRLVMQGASLNLIRDEQGRANWQLQEPNRGGGGELPFIRSLSMPAAHATLDDARRHLRFEGTVSAQDQPIGPGPDWFRIDGSGQLNGAGLTFAVVSDPLITASRDRPYRFTFSERSHPSYLSGHGSLARAFDFDNLESSFEAVGENLEDLFLLTGVKLINTGSYHLSGNLIRHGTTSTFTNLAASSGASDMNGTVTVETSSEKPRLTANLQSRLLHLSDLGARAAQHMAQSPTGAALLLSDAAISPVGVRHGDANVSFHAQRVDTARLSLRELAATLTVNHGVLTVSPLTAELLDGKLEGRLLMNAMTDEPADELHLQFHDLQIGQLEHNPKGPPSFEATLNARVDVTGRGRSLHQIGASASGRISASVPAGALRDSLAELSGVDLRGLGLMLAKSQKQTAVRCAAASFDAREGVLTSQTLVVDTDDVLIDGDGSIRLDNEALHVQLRGHPKRVRLLRLSSPVLLSGTLRHPSFALEHPKSIQLIDTGTARNADCTTLLKQ